MECLGLHNKPKAEVHPGHKLAGPKEEEEEEEEEETEGDYITRRFLIGTAHQMLLGSLQQGG
jgi:hypothetical protein